MTSTILVADDPDRRLAELPMLTDTEHQQLLIDWNQTAVDYPKDRCLHELVEEQAERTPEAVAAVFKSTQLTYRQLNDRANQLAHHLQKLGVGPDTLVGICLERSLEMVVGFLGILKAGGAYVPLDPGHPKERLAFMVYDSGVPVLLTRQGLRDQLQVENPNCQILCLDADWGTIARSPTRNLISGVSPENLAYVIYTSGSTGLPKGAMITHRSVCNHMRWMQATFPLMPSDNVLQKTSIAYDASVLEFWAPLLAGARLVSAEVTVPADINALIHTIREHQITVLLAVVPSLLRVLVDEQDFGNCESLRRVFCGGEELAADLQNRFLSACKADLINVYGPTECTIEVTWWQCQRGSGEPIVPIGRPVANTQAYILDRAMQPVPPGVTGELHIGGVQLARGYLGRPELTAEKFVQNPFGEGRLYKTGDLARYRSDGAIEYLGRIDSQVKIRGFRIELGEIETALRQHPSVQESIVIAREDIPGDKRLVAYVVARDHTPGDEGLTRHAVSRNGAASPSELRECLRGTLPDYMVPAAFVTLEALPLTPNGKVDRKALPRPDFEADESKFVAPSTPTEIVLASIWCEVLGLKHVGIHDNFFESGGHSLLALRIFSEIEKKLGDRPPLATLFQAPTIEKLATVLDDRSYASGIEVPPNQISFGCAVITPEMLPLVDLTQEEIDRIVSTVPGGAANVQDIYPLGPLQEGILFHHLMGGEGDPYLLFSQMSFDTRERLDRYIGAMQAVIDRHDILRTAMVWEGLPEPVQVVWRKASLHVEQIELDAAAGDASEQMYARFNPRHFRIDVSRAPLLRLYLAYDREKQRWLTMQLMHHLLIDHSTEEVMEAEVQAYLLGQEAFLPAPVPFRNLVAQARLGVSPREHEAFFRQMLGDVDEPTAPFGLLDVRGDGRGLEEARLQLDSDLARRLRDNARRLGVSAASLCHLAWARVLSKVSGRQDVVFGTVMFGRMQGGEGADRAMGPFINTLPVRIEVGEEQVEASVRSTHALLAGLIRHEHASLALAQRCSAVPAPAPLFSALFNYRHSAETPQTWEGIRMLHRGEVTTYPFTLSVDDLGQGFSLEARTAASIGPMRVCQFMRTALESLADALETSPATAVRALEVLPASERHRLLYEWNDTKAEYPRYKCVHELFEAQVDQTPDAIAVVCEDESLTYREVNRRANQLAHRLRKLGVGPEVIVGLFAERSVEMVVGLLGILKAGGAYLPLDPTYPQERLAFMIEDSQAPVLLTQSRWLDNLPSHQARIVCLDSDWAQIAQHSAANVTNDAHPEHLAYVIYTSGSTGKPKGVEISHRALSNYVQGVLERLQLEPGASMAMVSTIAADLGHTVLFGALCSGRPLHLIGAEAALDPDRFAQYMAAHQVGILKIVPSHLSALLQTTRPADVLPHHALILGGEVLPRTLLETIRQHRSNCRIINHYGPTETTVGVLTNEPAPGQELGGATVPIGRPLPNVQVYVLDRKLNPVPIGMGGELYIGGSQVARGYRNRPELTAERFIANPFRAGERLYRSGDLARYRSDGAIEYLGRIDSQVKIRGFRIELGEIETALRQHPSVQDSIVIAREDIPGDKRLVAYVVARDHTPGDEGLTRHAVSRNGAASPSELRECLRGTLPDYMVPAAFVTLEALPLTPNGKVDRKALPRPDFEAVADESKFVAPSTPTEIVLASIWCEVLGLKHVGIHDNFFESGGHSLLALRIFSEIEKKFGDRPPLATLFQAPTIEKLATVLDDRSWKAALSPLVAIQPRGSLPPFFSVHGGYGEVIFYSELAGCLGKDQPFYALRAEGLTRDTSIEAIASYYLQEIRQVQAHGPYFLGGYCMGGVIAFEMAQQLRAAGEEVALLVLFEAHNPDRPARLSTIGKRIRLALDESAGLRPSEKRRYIAHRIAAMLKRKAGNVQEVGWNLLELLHKTRRPDGENAYGGLLSLELPVRITLKRATAKYKPRGYPGRIVLFRAIAPEGHERADDRGWTEVAEDGLEVHDIPGKHTTIFERPHVQAGAEKLAACIQAALSR